LPHLANSIYSHYHSGLNSNVAFAPIKRAVENMQSNRKVKSRTYRIFVAALLLSSGVFPALPAQAAGDAEQGERLGYTCMGCHGIEGYRNAYPSFRVPRLAGQGTPYLESALQAYREGARPHPTMQAQASSMSDEDIDNLVAWLGSNEAVRDTMTTESAATVQAAAACVACHGAEGEGVIPQPPTLAGQHVDYLEYALNQYRDGTRGGTVMSAFVASLSDADIATLASYYASQDGLQTLQE
jgi:cytochrome c553